MSLGRSKVGNGVTLAPLVFAISLSACSGDPKDSSPDDGMFGCVPNHAVNCASRVSNR
jgi:hypothetical protein